MNELVTTNVFIDIGSYQREKEDLTYHLFKDLDFNDSKRHISFFRSDFRGSRFSNVKFFKNNFDRADFITCTFNNCQFDKVNFGSCEIKNCYFENVIFRGNIYNSISIQQCLFVNCQFIEEYIFTVMHECKFEKCIFTQCNFERSTTEKIEFIHCHIVGTDLATMHAERHRFISCRLEHICMGSSYFFGYLFYDTDISSVDFLYRGEVVSLNTIKDLYANFLKENRFFEFLNAAVILRLDSNKADIVKKSIDHLLIIKSVQQRKNEIINILDALCFYVKYSMLTFEEFVEISTFIYNYDWKRFTFEETLEYIGKTSMFSAILSSGEYLLSFDFLKTVPIKGIASIEFNCETEDYDEALEATSQLLDELNKKCNLIACYSLIEKKQGSWNLVFIIPVICAILLPVFVKNVIQTYDMLLSISFKKKFVETSKKILNSIDSIDELHKIAKVISDSQLIAIESSDISKDIFEPIKEIIKSIKVTI